MQNTIKLLDIDSKIMYALEVSEEDAKRASKDVSYATQLLQNYLDKNHENFSENETKSIESIKSLVKCGNDTLPSTSSTNSTSSTPLCTDTSVSKKEKTTDSPEKSNFMDGYRWSHEAILALFDVYRAEKHIILSGASMKKFWNIVSAKLNERGYYVNDIQCKSKMTGLKNTYKNIKNFNGKHTYSHRKWRYMDIMDEMYKKNQLAFTSSIIKTKDDSTQALRSIKPKHFNEDSQGNGDNEDNNVEKISLSSKPESSSRRVRQLERIISVVEENTIERKKMHKEAMIRQDKLLDILEKLYNSIKDKDEAHSSGSSSSNIQLPTKRLHKLSTTEKLITTIEESNSKRSRMHEDVMTRQDKLLSILEQMFEK